MNVSRKIVSLSKVASRNFHKTKAVASFEDGLVAKRLKMKETQDRFQVEDGTPVYIKGGIMDKVLLGTTYVLILVGLGMSAETTYELMTK